MKAKYEIEATHQVSARYTIEADGLEEALTKLCGADIFTEFSDGSFGFNERVMEDRGIKLDRSECYGDPSPTGRWLVTKKWEYQVTEPEPAKIDGCL